VAAAPTLLGDRLVADEPAEVDGDEIQLEAVEARLEQYNLLLYDRTCDSCCTSKGLCRRTPSAPPHDSDGTFL
jgi:hypothetical protein